MALSAVGAFACQVPVAFAAGPEPDGVTTAQAANAPGQRDGVPPDSTVDGSIASLPRDTSAAPPPSRDEAPTMGSSQPPTGRDTPQASSPSEGGDPAGPSPPIELSAASIESSPRKQGEPAPAASAADKRGPIGTASVGGGSPEADAGTRIAEPGTDSPRPAPPNAVEESEPSALVDAVASRPADQPAAGPEPSSGDSGAAVHPSIPPIAPAPPGATLVAASLVPSAAPVPARGLVGSATARQVRR